MNYDKTIEQCLNDFDNSILPALQEYVKIPNLSPDYDKEYFTNGLIEKAAKLMIDWALSQGIKGITGEIITEPNRTPLIFIQVEPFGSDKNLLFYAHMDKQPPLGQWDEGLAPTTPVIRGDYLYGRGASDDGYGLFALVESVKLIQSQNGKHGKISMTIEAGEESGSPDLIYYIKKLSDRIGVPDLMLCSDSGCKDYNTILLTTSVRGVFSVNLTVECLKEPIHSGSGSGICPDSFSVMRQLLDRIDDSKTEKVVAPIGIEIPSYRIEDAKKLAEYQKEKVITDMVKLGDNVKALSDDYAEIILNNTWRPTCVVIGMSGFPEVDNAGNVLRDKTTCKISCRIPPLIDNEKAQNAVVEILEKDPPFN